MTLSYPSHLWCTVRYRFLLSLCKTAIFQHKVETVFILPLLVLSNLTTGNCAHFHKGGWWYNACGQTNLNGVWYSGGVYRNKFQDGIFWADYGGGFYSMKAVRMMIRPID